MNKSTKNLIAKSSAKMLLTAWNTFGSEKPVKRFATLEAARKRMTKMIENDPKLEMGIAAFLEVELGQAPAAPVETPAPKEVAPVKAKRSRRAPKSIEEEEAALEESESEDDAPSDNLDSHARRSLAIAKSWNNPETAAKRSERSKVLVDGVLYKSVREAFEALGLPMSKRIRFRMELKAAKSLEAFGVTWTVTNNNDKE